MKKISLIFIASTGAGPVYSLEMAKALAANSKCRLQIIISKNVTNLSAWNEFLANTNVDYHVIDAYRRTKMSVILNDFNFYKQEKIVQLVRNFNADILYVPFGLMWARYVYWRLHRHVKIITTLHDVEFHDSIANLSIAELGSYILNYGSEKKVDGFVILNNKDKKIVESRLHRPVAVIPHAAFSYYFSKGATVDYTVKKKIGFFGRIEPYKGLDLLVEAFGRVTTKGLQLLIAGSGSIDDDLHCRIEQSSQITLINRYIDDEEFQPLLDKCDFVVLPYKRASQSGVIPMCFAYGKTVIVTNVGALSEQVPEGTGIVTEPDADHLAKQIDFFYASPKLICEYGRCAKEYAEKELSWKHSAELLLDFANTLLK